MVQCIHIIAKVPNTRRCCFAEHLNFGVMSVVVSHGFAGECFAYRFEVVVLALDFPFIGAANEMNQDVVVKQIGQLFEVCRVDTAKVGVLELSNGFHIHQHLQTAAKIFGPPLGGFMRRKWVGKIGLVALLAFTLTACSVKALNTSAILIDETSSLFLQVGADYNRMCAPNASPSLPAEDCERWKGFVPVFQAQYPKAVDAWTIIAQCRIDEAQVSTGRDCGSQVEVLNIVAGLKTIVLGFVVAGL